MKYQLKRETENGKLVIVAETDFFIQIMQFFSCLKSHQNLEHLSVWMDGVKLE